MLTVTPNLVWCKHYEQQLLQQVHNMRILCCIDELHVRLFVVVLQHFETLLRELLNALLLLSMCVQRQDSLSKLIVPPVLYITGSSIDISQYIYFHLICDCCMRAADVACILADASECIRIYPNT